MSLPMDGKIRTMNEINKEIAEARENGENIFAIARFLSDQLCARDMLATDIRHGAKTIADWPTP